MSPEPVRPALPVAVALVAAGGAVGGVARHVLALALPPAGGLPVGTLAANLLGCLALGLLVARASPASRLRPLLGTGVLGGFTTFSTLALEVDRLVADAPTLALAHLALNTGGGLALAALGLRLGRR